MVAINKYKRWTEDEVDELEKLYNTTNLTKIEIGNKLNRNKKSIEYALINFGIAKSKRSVKGKQDLNSLHNEFLIILEVLSEYFKISVDRILELKNDREISSTRQIAHYILVKHTGYTYEKIAKKIGQLDHSVINHSLKVVKNLMSIDKKYKEDVLKIEEVFINRCKSDFSYINKKTDNFLCKNIFDSIQTDESKQMFKILLKRWDKLNNLLEKDS